MVVLHVGFPKTGTTFLQTGFFARCEGIRYLGKPYVNGVLGHLVRDICFQDSSTFSLERWRSTWRDRDHWVPGEGPWVISEEGLTFHEVRDSLTCARRCAEVFGEARILFTVRNQIDTLVSYFRNHALLNTTCYACKGRVRAPLSDWLDYQWRAMEWRHKTYVSSLRYEAVISQWVEVFGRDRIEVRSFEDMKADTVAFFGELSDTLGVGPVMAPMEGGPRRNRGRSRRRLLFERLRNRFWEDPSQRLPNDSPVSGRPDKGSARRFGVADSFFRFLERGRPLKIDMSDSWKTRLTEFFRDGNERLAIEYGLDLRAHGYPL